jgi:hypothetical protein
MPTYRSRPPEDHGLLCALNDDELRLKGQQLAEAESALQDVKRDKDAANAVFKTREDAAKGVVTSLTGEILSKQERRATECVWIVEPWGDKDVPTWVLRRRDTRSVVTTQAVTQADRQQELSLS